MNNMHKHSFRVQLSRYVRAKLSYINEALVGSLGLQAS